MNPHCRVLVLAATGRTGRHVLTQLLERGVPVRAIVRSADRLPPGAADNPLLDLVEADLLALAPEALAEHLEGCDTVISCLGHTVSARGVLGPPRDLVTSAVRPVRAAVEVRQPEAPLRLILMSSVSVHRPGRADARRGRGERAYLRVLGALVPPVRDNQAAADLLAQAVGPDDPHLQWVVVRPDTLTEGEIGEYRLHDALVASIFRAERTRMSEVAHFMCELATDDTTWQRWRSRMPVIVDAASAR